MAEEIRQVMFGRRRRTRTQDVGRGHRRIGWRQRLGGIVQFLGERFARDQGGG